MYRSRFARAHHSPNRRLQHVHAQAQINAGCHRFCEAPVASHGNVAEMVTPRSPARIARAVIARTSRPRIRPWQLLAQGGGTATDVAMSSLRVCRSSRRAAEAMNRSFRAALGPHALARPRQPSGSDP
jgi:hypothetical protein